MADLSSMSANRSELARMYSGDPNPDPDLVRLVRANLVCARLDNRIRDYIRESEVQLNESHVAHLVGLLLSNSGVGGEAIQRVEKLAREAVSAAQGGAQ